MHCNLLYVKTNQGQVGSQSGFQIPKGQSSTPFAAGNSASIDLLSNVLDAKPSWAAFEHRRNNVEMLKKALELNSTLHLPFDCKNTREVLKLEIVWLAMHEISLLRNKTFWRHRIRVSLQLNIFGWVFPPKISNVHAATEAAILQSSHRRRPAFCCTFSY